MTLEELEQEYKPKKKEDAPCDPCRRAKESVNLMGESYRGHMILVGMEDGTAEYRIMTEDGRLVPADEWMI